MSKEDIALMLRTTILQIMESEPDTIEGLPGWYKASGQVKDFLGSECGELNLPHFLWHYLDDADIRLRNSRYAVIQNNQLREFIEELGISGGDLPEENINYEARICGPRSLWPQYIRIANSKPAPFTWRARPTARG